jgi:tetratricopeptide (TPR) repeat protein
VPQILDVAIQTAWGLHALHELGLVHHDMKPSNVLMTSDGLAKVTDFGLAKACVSAGERPSTLTTRGSILVSSGGRTPAYCSPEQSAGLEITKKTDIWSWAISVLEMFTGEVTWPAGQLADAAFEDYWLNVAERSREIGIVPMPRAVATILKKCLRRNPEERWTNLTEVAEELKKVYRESSGRAYARQMPPMPKSSVPGDVGDDGVDDDSAGGIRWLRLAYQAAGRSVPEKSAWRSSRAMSGKARAIAALALYDEAQRVLEKLIENGRTELKDGMSLLCFEKAAVHSEAEDFSAALHCYDYVVNEWREASSLLDNGVAAERLAIALQAKANLLCDLGELRAAVVAAGEAIEIMESLLKQRHDSRIEQRLASACHSKANAAFDLAEYDMALEFYDREISIYEGLPARGDEEGFSLPLADGYMSKGNAIWASGNPNGAIPWHNKAIEIWDRAVKNGRDDLSRNLAKAFFNKAITLKSAGDAPGAIEWHGRSSEIYRRLVEDQGQWQIANELANVYIGRANAINSRGHDQESLVWFEKAIDIYDTLANQQGRQEFAGDLARVRALLAFALADLGEQERALLEAERALPVLQRELIRTGRSGFAQLVNQLQNLMRRGA